MTIDTVLFGAQVISTKKDQQVKTLWACGQSSLRLIRRRTWWLQVSLSRGDATSALSGFIGTSWNLEMLHGFLDGGKTYNLEERSRSKAITNKTTQPTHGIWSGHIDDHESKILNSITNN